MRRTAADPALTRALLLRVSMIASLRRAEELGAAARQRSSRRHDRHRPPVGANRHRNEPRGRGHDAGNAGRAGRVGAAPSLRDQAYEAIKHQIITCAFKPGQAINEAQVALLLGLGRTPVHQALDRLMVEELVDILPRKGVVVRPLSLSEVLQITDARLVNECPLRPPRRRPRDRRRDQATGRHRRTRPQGHGSP